MKALPLSARVHQDVHNLLQRVRCRQYPETLPVLESYWLRTVYRKNYQRNEWRELDSLLAVDPRLAEIRNCIREEGLLNGKKPAPLPLLPERRRPAPGHDLVLPYVIRLLNEWMPREMAVLMVDAPDDLGGARPGLPVLESASVIERLLRREALPAQSLELMLEAGVFTPQMVYPADYEILRDVVLLLLGRTEAPPVAVTPATLLTAPSDFGSEFENAVHRSTLISVADGDELQVPLRPGRAFLLMNGRDSVQIPSLIVSMDGRYWKASAVAAGGRDSIAYRPCGRLHIDFSHNEPRLQMRWPQTRDKWHGPAAFPHGLAFFGRRWRVIRWEQDASGAWLTLASVGAFQIDAAKPAQLRRSRPASVDIAWSAVETALAESSARGNSEPLERLRHEALIPLARALHTLAECSQHATPDAFAARLSSVAYHGNTIQEPYGLPRWSVLPKRAQSRILSRARAEGLEDRLRGVFTSVPAVERWWNKRSRAA